MKVSIIMSSYCRAELLNFGLMSLTKQKIDYDYEIIVLNDGIEDNTKNICNLYKNKLNIKYIFTGQRNKNKLKWRCPGAAFNIGVENSKGDIIILSSPEIFHITKDSINQLVQPLIKNSKRLTITEGKDDVNSVFLNYLKTAKGKDLTYSMYKHLHTVLNTKLNFCMGMSKTIFKNIGGFDKDFFDGYCFDDDDLIDRLIEYGCYHYQVSAKVVHLYNNRMIRKGLNRRSEKLQRNKELYLKKKKERQQNQIKPQEIINKSVPVELKKEWHLHKIPKIIHFYWGESYLPYLRYLSIYTFMHYNPDWQIKFYYPKVKSKHKSWSSHEHKFTFTGKDYYNKLRELPIEFIEFDFDKIGIDNNISEVYKSNFLTWYILSTEGGLFSDTDIIYFDSMNYLYNNRQDSNVDTLICYLWHGHTMGFLLSSSNNEFFKYIFEQSKSYFNTNNYQSIGTVMLNKLFPTIETIRNKYPNLNIETIDSKAVYAYNIKYIEEIYKQKELTRFNDNSIGLHWYAGHPLSMEAINNIHEKNFRRNNVLSEVIDIALKLKILDKLRKNVTERDSVLDVGCGDKRLSYNLRHAKKVITLDAFEKYNPDIIHNLNYLPLPIKDNEYDITLFIDVIEHLEKEQGKQVLEELKRITKKKIFLFTPQYWVDNKISVDMTNNIFNYHKSLWYPEDFKNWIRIGNIGNLKKWYFGQWTKLCEDLTIHCMVRNEPFIYYAIKSIYPYAKEILLYDTGSYDKYTIKDIETLLKEDVDRKIRFKQILIETDETKWNVKNLKQFIKNNEGKFGKGRVRQMMIDDTKTKFFMVLDGDEVRYAQTMETLVNNALPNCPENIYLIRTPINWFYDLEHTFTGKYSYPFSGGIYRTDKVKMNNVSPNEHHIAKETGEKLVNSKHSICWTKNIIPYAHFETLLKPHRRKKYIDSKDIHKFTNFLPKVMQENPYYIERFLKENKYDKRS